MNEWIKIDRQNDKVPPEPFLLSDEYGYVYVGSTPFDYYDAEYWFPIPQYPFPDSVVTNDECISALLKDTPLDLLDKSIYIM